jgi:hypothetical protein
MSEQLRSRWAPRAQPRNGLEVLNEFSALAIAAP